MVKTLKLSPQTYHLLLAALLRSIAILEEDARKADKAKQYPKADALRVVAARYEAARTELAEAWLAGT